MHYFKYKLIKISENLNIKWNYQIYIHKKLLT